MPKDVWFCLDGDLQVADKPGLLISNRGFKYGDSLFETIRCHGSTPIHFKDHYRRLIAGMVALKMDVHSLPCSEQLEKTIEFLIIKNKLFKQSRLRLTVFRKGQGLYTPLENGVSYLLEVASLASQGYQLNEKGLVLLPFMEMQKQVNLFSSYKNGNSLLFVMAGLFKKEHGVDDCFIFNDKGLVIEALSSNLFWIKDDVFYTPFVSSGCVDGVMRRQVVRLIEKSGGRLVEVAGTSMEELVAADELFLTNAIQGIQWVVGIGEQRFFSKQTRKLSLALNQQVFS